MLFDAYVLSTIERPNPAHSLSLFSPCTHSFSAFRLHFRCISAPSRPQPHMPATTAILWLLGAIAFVSSVAHSASLVDLGMGQSFDQLSPDYKSSLLTARDATESGTETPTAQTECRWIPDPGPCQGFFRRYYYDWDTRVSFSFPSFFIGFFFLVSVFYLWMCVRACVCVKSVVT